MVQRSHVVIRLCYRTESEIPLSLAGPTTHSSRSEPMAGRISGAKTVEADRLAFELYLFAAPIYRGENP